MGVEGACALQRLDIDDEVGERSEVADGGAVAHLRALDAQGFGLRVDALGRGALAIEVFVGCGVAIEEDAHEATRLNVDVLDTAGPFGKLLMLTGLGGGAGMEQRTAGLLGAIALRMSERSERIGRTHGPSLGAEGRAVRAALRRG